MNKSEHRFDNTICDEIANLIITKHQEINPNLSSRIWVTWVERFFVVNGYTDLNLSDIFDLSSFINNELSKKYEDWLPINIFDFIDYETNHFITNQFLPKKTYKIKRNDELLKINLESIKSKTPSTFIKPITSDDFYGLSLNLKKPHILALKIANHIFNANYTSNQVIINFKDDSFTIQLKDGIVSDEFATNVVDACFGGKIEDEYEKILSQKFDFINVLNKTKTTYPWMIRDYIKDFVMV